MTDAILEQLNSGVSVEEANVKTGKREINKYFPQWCIDSWKEISTTTIDKTMESLGIIIISIIFICFAIFSSNVQNLQSALIQSSNKLVC